MSDGSEKKIEFIKRKRESSDEDIDITPMIDIVFLLLAFFVVVSKMDPTDPVAFPNAKNGDSISERTIISVFVISNEKDNPSVYLGKKNDDFLCQGDLEDVERLVAEFVRRELLADPLKTAVVIKADRSLKYRFIELFKQAIGEELDESQTLNVAVEEK